MNTIIALLIVLEWAVVYFIISEHPPIGIDPRRWRRGCFFALKLIPFVTLLVLYLLG